MSTAAAIAWVALLIGITNLIGLIVHCTLDKSRFVRKEP